jgi:conjugative transfer region lipoprotein (TIGR03751 family)
MVRQQWINTTFLHLVVCVNAALLLPGCASHIDNVVPQDLPTMKHIYDEKAGNGGAAVLRQREADIRARPINTDEDYLSDLPPRAAQIKHLFPALPNPELYMYVKPHVVGSSGAAVPAYMTRFTLYERTHYALPNEVVSKIKHPGVVPPPTDKKPNNTPNTTRTTSSEPYGN